MSTTHDPPAARSVSLAAYRDDPQALVLLITETLSIEAVEEISKTLNRFCIFQACRVAEGHTRTRR